MQLDPLNSPFPVPWSWVMANQSEEQSVSHSKIRYYRSPSLISPNGQYAAYSRIQMQVLPNFTQSRVSSILFIENLKTRNLQTITATSPFADNPFVDHQERPPTGTIAILIPVAWSQDSDRILAREFESLFGTDIASDFAVIWEHQFNQIQTFAPMGISYTNAVLLGWSRMYANRVLFKAGHLGEEDWMQWAVNDRGETAPATEDCPIVFGQMVNHVWAGPQSHR
jgi:hypothetical protein